MSDDLTGTLLAAFIDAIASVVVASMGRKRAVAHAIPAGNRRAWTLLVPLYFLWSWVSPFVFGWPLAGVNLFALLPFAVFMAAIWPIRPSRAAAAILMLAAVHSLLLAVWQATEGVARDAPANFMILLGIALVSATVAAMMTGWGVRRYRLVDGARPIPAGAPAAPQGRGESLAEEIGRLHELRKSGALTEREFEAAKRRLLG